MEEIQMEICIFQKKESSLQKITRAFIIMNEVDEKVINCKDCNVSFRNIEGNCDCCPYRIGQAWRNYHEKKHEPIRN